MPRAVTIERFTSEVLDLYAPPLRSRRTQKKMRMALKRLASISGVRRTSDLTPDAIARFCSGSPETCGPNTLRGLLGYLSAACSYAVHRGYLKSSPFAFRPPGKWVRPAEAAGGAPRPGGDRPRAGIPPRARRQLGGRPAARRRRRWWPTPGCGATRPCTCTPATCTSTPGISMSSPGPGSRPRPWRRRSPARPAGGRVAGVDSPVRFDALGVSQHDCAPEPGSAVPTARGPSTGSRRRAGRSASRASRS